jgi:hypothetical protein
MRRILALTVLAALVLTNAGCLLNRYDGDPNRRMQQLIWTSENERQIRDEWARFWMIDQPSHMTYDRVHGGLGP